MRLIWESLRDAIPLLFSLMRQLCAVLRRSCRRRQLPERERRRSPNRCVPINEPAFTRPDLGDPGPVTADAAAMKKFGTVGSCISRMPIAANRASASCAWLP
jgi:hypothetical protein